jgi:hypothetical protein
VASRDVNEARSDGSHAWKSFQLTGRKSYGHVASLEKAEDEPPVEALADGDADASATKQCVRSHVTTTAAGNSRTGTDIPNKRRLRVPSGRGQILEACRMRQE